MDSNNMNSSNNTNSEEFDAFNSYETQNQYTTYTGTTMTSPIIEESKKGKGIVGAFMGALIGGIIWTIIGCLGLISGWIAILIFFLAQFGYKKMTGKMDQFGVVISLIFGLLIIIPATYASYGFSLFQALNDGASSHFTYFEVLSSLPVYMERYDLWGEFIGNLLMGYLFTGVAAFYVGASAIGDKAKAKKDAKKKAKNEQNIK